MTDFAPLDDREPLDDHEEDAEGPENAPGANAVIPRPLDRTRDIWLLQPGESAEHFQIFKRYLTQTGRRSIRGLATELGRSNPALWRLSKQWRWAERCRAWDEVEEQQAMEELGRHRATVRQKQFALSADILNLVAESIKIKAQDPGALRGSELATLLREASRIQVEAIGGASSVTRIEHTGAGGAPLGGGSVAAGGAISAEETARLRALGLLTTPIAEDLDALASDLAAAEVSDLIEGVEVTQRQIEGPSEVPMNGCLDCDEEARY